jgi:isocitrate dehydrogenase
MFKPVEYKEVVSEAFASETTVTERSSAKKELVGVDVFLDWLKGSADDLGSSLSQLNGDGLHLTMMSNRGVKVWPGGQPETFCSDHWRCRFIGETEGTLVAHAQIVSLLKRVGEAGFDFIKTENLYNFDGQRGYSLDQGA